MRNLIEESRVKSEMFEGFNTVNVKFEKGGRVYVYELYRSSHSEIKHLICCTSFEQSDCERAFTWNEKRMTKTYTDSAKFDAAIKRIQSKMS